MNALVAYYCPKTNKWIKPDIHNFHRIGQGKKLELIPESQLD